MKVQTLKDVPIESICKAFNQAFENYYVEIKLNTTQFHQKIIDDQIKLHRSVAVFDEEELIAFVLHAEGTVNGKKAFYNAGTGIIPAYRGKGLTIKMYEFILPLLQQEGFELGVLEVITKNIAAIKSYQKIGFKIEEELVCYKNVHAPLAKSSMEEIIQLDSKEINWETLEEFWDWSPTWQYSSKVLQNRIQEISFWAYLEEGNILAYALVDAKTHKILQFAVDKSRRKEKIASALFHHLVSAYQRNFSLINIRNSDLATASFLDKMNFKEFIRQYEMHLWV